VCVDKLSIPADTSGGSSSGQQPQGQGPP
jgi:hypothetical protein